MSTGNTAEELAEQTFDAVASARASLRLAVQSAAALDGPLSQTEESVRELPVPPQAHTTEEQRALILLAANERGHEINASVEQSEIQVAAVRSHLADASAAVTRAKGFLQRDALSAESPANLRERLTRLETAIATARTSVEGTAKRLGKARDSIGPLIKLHGDYDDQAMSSIYDASSAVTEQLSGLQADVGTISAAHTRATELTTPADDLAAAVRAASNPTPPSGRQTPAPLSEQDHRDRAGRPSQGSQLNR